MNLTIFGIYCLTLDVKSFYNALIIFPNNNNIYMKKRNVFFFSNSKMILWYMFTPQDSRKFEYAVTSVPICKQTLTLFPA